MKGIILLAAIALLSIGCNHSGVEEMDSPQGVTRIAAHVATNKTRVELDVNPDIEDKAYWKEGDFLFVAEITENGSLFTGHILKYNYVLPNPLNKESKGAFNGVGMVTGGKYLIVNTNISYMFIGLPQLGDSFFQCTFKRNFYCTASFGEKPAEVQQIANEMLFVGAITILDSDTDIDIPLTSPMSMIEVRLTTDTPINGVEKITIESADAVFSYKVYSDQSGDCQGQSVLNNYNWEKLNSEVVFTVGHYQSLNNVTPLKIRVVAFQKKQTQTSLIITATMEDGSTLSYTTPTQTQTLVPNGVTVVNARLK